MWVRLALLVAVLGAAVGNEFMIVPDAGRRLLVGELYDARTHKQVGGSLWSKELIQELMVEKPARASKYDFSYDDKLSDKLSLLSVDVDFALSFMGGDIQIEGAVKFLNDKKKTSKATRMSLMQSIRTVKQTIDPFHDRLITAMNAQVIRKNIATHVVTGVTFGAESIATFETEYSNKEESQKVGVFLKMLLDLGENVIDIGVNVTIQEEERKMYERTKTKLNGDVVPPVTQELPTRPDEAVKFLRQMHQFSLGEDGKGVGITLELTPISWLTSEALALVYKIEEDVVARAVKAYESLDVSEELILDLLRLNEGPYRAWKDDVEGYYRKFLQYRLNFAQTLAHAVSQRRNGLVDIQVVSDVLEGYYSSSFSDISVQQTVEAKQDSLLNLLALTEQMKAAGVTLAESYSEFQAPTFNSLYDKVYALIIVGMIPSSDREAIGRVREFTALSEATQVLPSMNVRNRKVKHCIMRQPEGAPAPVCIDRLKFVAIHFDSFCNEFCPARYCAPPGEGAACPMARNNGTCSVSPGVKDQLGCWERTAQCDKNDPTQVYSVTTPLQECWCACPRTQIIEFANSQKAVRSDELPVKPGKPVIEAITGGEEAEEHPLQQRMTVELKNDDLGIVRNFRVKVLWNEATRGLGDSLEWVQRERVVDTRDANRSILISELASGQRYRFEVSGINSVGEGPASVISDYIYASHNRPMISPRTITTRHTSEPMNRLPSWRTFNNNGKVPVTVLLSTPAKEVASEVVFYPYGAPEDSTPLFKCEGYEKGTTSGIQCIVPLDHLASRITEDTVVEARVYGLSGDKLAWGNVTLEGPSSLTCHEWEFTHDLLCDMEIDSVVDEAVERSPLNQVVKMTLIGSTHHRDLIRYRVRVAWKEPGVAGENEFEFETNTARRIIYPNGLAAGRIYQFQVAGVESNGVPGPYSPRFPQSGIKVASNMPIINPIPETNHFAIPLNAAPAWFYSTTGRIRVSIHLSTTADEPMARLTLHAPGVSTPALECTNYGPQSTRNTSCVLPVSRLPTGFPKMEAKVWGVNGNLVASTNDFEIHTPSVENCFEWETTKRKLCDLVSEGGTMKCVEDCESCTFNTKTTKEFAGRCSTDPCPGITDRTYCPDSDECFETTAEADRGCKSKCGGDTVLHILSAGRGMCAVPCELASLPGVRVAPGATYNVPCGPGYVTEGTETTKPFTCPSENGQRSEVDAETDRPAPWAPKPADLPSCRRCLSYTDCNDRAVEVSSNADRTQCLCQCHDNFDGPSCNRCAPGHVYYPICLRCDSRFFCSGHAATVLTNPEQTQCQCQCQSGYTGPTCNRCSPGYYGYPTCAPCQNWQHCNNRALTVTSDGETCKCSCRYGYAGANCGECASGFFGWPHCVNCYRGRCFFQEFVMRDLDVSRIRL